MNRQAWQEHARQRQASEPPGPAAVPARMYWTPTPDHGPGAEILGELASATVVELGCGAGRHLAHLVAAHGVIGLGVDIASGQIERAQARYGHLHGITFIASDAVDFLAAARPGAYDVCYSVFGAVGLSPPDRLLSAIAMALRPGGRFAFSVPHPRRCGRDNFLLLPFGGRVPIQRWEPAVPEWAALLAASRLGLEDVCHLTGPDRSAGPTTLLVVARKR